MGQRCAESSAPPGQLSAWAWPSPATCCQLWTPTTPAAAARCVSRGHTSSKHDVDGPRPGDRRAETPARARNLLENEAVPALQREDQVRGGARPRASAGFRREAPGSQMPGSQTALHWPADPRGHGRMLSEKVATACSSAGGCRGCVPAS